MMACHYRPGPPLSPFVNCFWYFDGYSTPYKRERALPTGTTELVVSLGKDRIRVFRDDTDVMGQMFRRSVICGAQSGYFVLDTSQEESVIGINFRPGGAAPFLGVPASEVSDSHVGLEDIWGNRARMLRERLLESQSPDAMFALLEQELLGRLARPLLPHPAIANALRQLTAMPALVRIAQLQNESGYCPKRFIELFRASVGLTPKVYCRIRRFQAVLALLSRGDRVEWASVALDGGYCDQSHLNREFRAFAGVTPTEYRPVTDDRPNHVGIEPA